MQDKFYFLRPAVATEETGSAYPQAGISLDYDKNAENSYRKLKSFQLPDYTPSFNYFVLDPDASPTDLISGSVSYYGLLISEEFASLLEGYKIQEHTLFEATVKFLDEDLQYYWLHLGRNNVIDIIDYQKSEFYYKIGIESKSEVQLRNYEDYWTVLKNLGNFATVANVRLVLKSYPDYDLFVIPFFDGRIYISQRLKEAIGEAKITGVSIEESNKLLISKLEY